MLRIGVQGWMVVEVKKRPEQLCETWACGGYASAGSACDDLLNHLGAMVRRGVSSAAWVLVVMCDEICYFLLFLAAALQLLSYQAR
jgi:hypothetical protein